MESEQKYSNLVLSFVNSTFVRALPPVSGKLHSALSSFVNGIATTKGGKHIDYVVNQVTKKIVEYILKKKKKNVKQTYIKDNIWIFFN